MTSLLSASGTYLLFDEKDSYALYALRESKDNNMKSFSREWAGSDLNVLLMEHRLSEAHRALRRAIIRILYTQPVEQLLKDLTSSQSELLLYHHTATHAEALYKVNNHYILTFRPLRIGASIKQCDIVWITKDLQQMKNAPSTSSRFKSFVDTVSTFAESNTVESK
jgi:hypothetical protein